MGLKSHSKLAPGGGTDAGGRWGGGTVGEEVRGRRGEREAAGEGFLQEVTHEGSLEGWGQSVN